MSFTQTLTDVGLTLLKHWKTLAMYVVGMVIYSVFVFRLYKFISKKDIFELDLKSYARGAERFKNIFKSLLYVLEYLILFPLLSMVWFLVFTTLLALLSTTHTVDSLLLVSMAVVTTVRVCAYYSSALAEDLSKTLPLALLGVALVEGLQSLSVSNASKIITSLGDRWKVILSYMAFLIVLEFVMRTLTVIFRGTLETEDEHEEEKE